MAVGFLSTLLICLALLVVFGTATQLRFDFFSTWGCPKDDPAKSNALSETCDPAKRKAQKTSQKFCMCNRDLTRLTETGNHYIAYGGNDPQHLAAIATKGNELAWLVDGITKSYESGKSAETVADEMWATANRLYPSKVPKYWILDELSVKLWFRLKILKYHKWAVTLVTRLKNVYGVIPILCSPSSRVDPRKFKNDWKNLSKAGYIGIEFYGVTSQEVKRRKYNVAWLTKWYRKGLDTYVKAGVPKKKIIFVDHFGATPFNKGFGSSGLKPREWKKVIAARAKAVKALKVGGFFSYGWVSYYKDTPAMREGFYTAYNKGFKSLP
jgi:hypothetical protein